MFEEIARGSYEHYRDFCRWAHPGLGAGVFTFGAPGVPSAGCQFDSLQCSIVGIPFFKLLYGFINHFPNCFPSYPRIADRESEDERKKILELLDAASRVDSGNPKTIAWHEVMDRLVR
jgi:hypothetical protein